MALAAGQRVGREEEGDGYGCCWSRQAGAIRLTMYDMPHAGFGTRERRGLVCVYGFFETCNETLPRGWLVVGG